MDHECSPENSDWVHGFPLSHNCDPMLVTNRNRMLMVEYVNPLACDTFRVHFSENSSLWNRNAETVFVNEDRPLHSDCAGSVVAVAATHIPNRVGNQPVFDTQSNTSTTKMNRNWQRKIDVGC